MYSAANTIYEILQQRLGAYGVPETVITVAAYAIPCAVVLGVISSFAGMLTYAERKISADIQNRIGPNRVGPFGLLQFPVDGIKLLLKEDIIPDAADKTLFKLAPYLVFTSTVLASLVIPFGGSFVVADLVAIIGSLDVVAPEIDR